MDMVCVASHFYHLTVEFVADATEVAVQFCFNRWMYQRLSVLGTENDVNIVFYE